MLTLPSLKEPHLLFVLQGRFAGIKKIVIGALILSNAFVWSRWLGIDGWIAFAGALMILLGLVKLLCPCCGGTCGLPAKKSKKK